MSLSLRRAAAGRWLPLAAAVLLPVCALPARAQMYDANAAPQDGAVDTSDPSALYVRAYTSALQGESLESEGKLRPALAKYRFAASMLDQLSQSNPNWQPLIVGYRQRKTIESIRKLEEKGVVQNPGSVSGQPLTASTSSYGRPATLPNVPPTLAPGADDDLPAPDGTSGRPAGRNNGTVNVMPEGVQPPPAVSALEVVDRSTKELRNKLEKTQRELKSALDALAAAKKDKETVIKQKDELESQMQFSRAEVKIAQKRYEHTKTDRDELQNDLTKAETRLKDAVAKNPAVAEARKDLHDHVEELRKQLAKAQADTDAAAKARDEIQAKFDTSEKLLAQTTRERDAAVARNELTKDAAQKIEALQNENSTLTQKLSSAESSITKLTAESLRKKQDLDGMQKELTTLKDQLASSRDQNDRGATTITTLRQQLDESAKRLVELKAKGMSTDDFTKMSKENEMLRAIVMRQLKDQSRRAAAKQLLAEELTRLDAQSSTLDRQLEVLGQPSVQLTDAERALFKDPMVTMADAGNPSSMATITAVRPGQPGAAKAADGIVTTPEDAARNVPPDDVPAADGSNKGGPMVRTNAPPRVSEELLPMAREARDDFDRQHYAEAERTYDKLLARDPKNPYLLSNQGVVLFRQDKLKSAEVMLKKAVAAAPNDAFGQSTLGIVYYRMHRYDEAMSSLTTAITINPKNPTAHNYLGITASQKGYPEAAIDELQKAIALNPNYSDAYFNLAVVDATKVPPDKTRAREAYNTAVRLGASADPTLEKLIGN